MTLLAIKCAHSLGVINTNQKVPDSGQQGHEINPCKHIHSSTHLKIGTSRKWVVIYTLRPPYFQGKNSQRPFHRRPCGPQKMSGHFEEEKNLLPPPGIELLLPSCSARSLVATATTLFRLQKCALFRFKDERYVLWRWQFDPQA